jgi:hypothetical protein
MKKNLFDNGVSEQVLLRAARLSENSKPTWGTMNAAEMLRHCSAALVATLSTPKEIKPTTLRQRIKRFAMLNFIPAFPKGARTPDVLDMKKNNMAVDNLPEELESFKHHVIQFAQHPQPILVSHPYFGTMSNKQWGILTWMHLDHHLRQFGV